MSAATTQTPAGPGRLFAADVGELAGVSAETIKRYHNIAQASRDRLAQAQAAGTPLDQVEGRLPAERDIPVPDGWDYPPHRRSGSKSPWWHAETLRPWLAIRQGPGNPRGGPPRQRKARRAKPGPKPASQPRPRRPAGRAGPLKPAEERHPEQ